MASYNEVEDLKSWMLDYVVATQVCGFDCTRTVSYGRTAGLHYSKKNHEGKFEYSPSTKWIDGGPLIESYGLGVSQDSSGLWTCTSKNGVSQRDFSLLTAVMRALIVELVEPPYHVPE